MIVVSRNFYKPPVQNHRWCPKEMEQYKHCLGEGRGEEMKYGKIENMIEPHQGKVQTLKPHFIEFHVM